MAAFKQHVHPLRAKSEARSTGRLWHGCRAMGMGTPSPPGHTNGHRPYRRRHNRPSALRSPKVPEEVNWNALPFTQIHRRRHNPVTHPSYPPGVLEGQCRQTVGRQRAQQDVLGRASFPLAVSAARPLSDLQREEFCMQ
jgi:hypothetical protein